MTDADVLYVLFSAAGGGCLVGMFVVLVSLVVNR